MHRICNPLKTSIAYKFPQIVQTNIYSIHLFECYAYSVVYCIHNVLAAIKTAVL
jgi:hypothetical protein